MSSNGTLPRATPEEVLAALLVERDLVDIDIVDDVRAAVADEANGNIVEALIDSEILPLETAELIVDELARGILTCPGCPGRFNVASLARGARFKCKTCGNAVTVPALEITRTVLGRFGWADEGRDVDAGLPAAVPVIEEPRPVVTSDEDAIDQAMAVGTGEGQLLDFTDADVHQETIDGTNPLGTPAVRKSKPRSKSKPRARRGAGPKRASRRAAPATDADFDEALFDEGDEEDTKDPNFTMRLIGWVIIPIAMCAVVMYYTGDIKTWMFGAPDNDTGGYYDPSTGTYSGGDDDYEPSIKAEECDDWQSVVASAEAALALVEEARTAASAGDTDGARAKYLEAGAKFQEAYEFWDEVLVAYGKHCDHLEPKIQDWANAGEAADKEARKLP